MKYASGILLLVSTLLLFACQKENVTEQTVPAVITVGHPCAMDSGSGNWVFFQDGKSWLYGGENEDWHFNISNL